MSKDTGLELIGPSLAAMRGWTAGHKAAPDDPLSVELTNNSAANLVLGDVVIVKTDGTIEKCSALQDTRPVGIVLDDIDIGESGPVQFFGPVEQITTTGAVTAGEYAVTSATAGKATSSAARAQGAFAIFTGTGTSPAGFLFGGAPDGAAGLTVAETDGTVVATGVDKLVVDDGVATSLGSGDVQLRGLPAGTIGARALRSTAQVIANATWTALSLSSGETWDTDSFHDLVTNPSRMTIPAGLAGKYLCIGAAYWDASTAGVRYVTFAKNGTRQGDYAQGAVNVANHITQMTDVIDLAAGDYLELHVHQTTGGNLNGYGYLLLIKLDSGRVGTGIGASAYNNAVQSIPDTTVTAVTLNSEDFNLYGFHSTSSNTSRMTVPAGLGGLYLVMGSGRFTANATGARTLKLAKNGVDFRQIIITGDADGTDYELNGIVSLAAGDYVELLVAQTSGGALNFGHASARSVQGALQIMRLDSLPPAEQGTWQSYTPVLTNGSVGNGTMLAKWKKIDSKTIAWAFSWVFGTTSAISGNLIIGLPTGITTAARIQIVPGLIRDAGTRYYGCVARFAASATATSEIPSDSTGVAVTTTVPMTWANTDELQLEGILEIA